MAIAIALLVLAIAIALIKDKSDTQPREPRDGPAGTPRPDADDDR